MFFDNRADDGEAQTALGAAVFGGEEGFEEEFCGCWIHSDARVGHSSPNITPRICLAIFRWNPF